MALFAVFGALMGCTETSYANTGAAAATASMAAKEKDIIFFQIINKTS